MKHVRFPLEVVPLYSLATSLISLFIGLLVLLPVLAWRQGGLPWGVVGLPLILLAQFAFTIGLAWLLGAVGAFLRDIKELVQITFMIGMFLTPIFYVESVLPDLLRPIIWLNPLAHLARALSRRIADRDAVRHPASRGLWPGGPRHLGRGVCSL